MLLKTNIFDSKKVVINISQKSINFSFCEKISAFINIIAKERRIFRAIKNANQLTIFAYFCVFVSVKIKKNILSLNRNYFFYFKQNFVALKSKDSFFNYIIDANIVVVQIRNILNRSYVLSKNAKIDMLRDFEKKECYLAASKNCYRTVSSFKS